MIKLILILTLSTMVGCVKMARQVDLQRLSENQKVIVSNHNDLLRTLEKAKVISIQRRAK